eukprot:1094562-Pleurochrysis_carterae.AAC.1
MRTASSISGACRTCSRKSALAANTAARPAKRQEPRGACACNSFLCACVRASVRARVLECEQIPAFARLRDSATFARHATKLVCVRSELDAELPGAA